MVLSLAVVMAGVLVFVFFVMPSGRDETAVKVVETTAPMESFARQSPYAPLGPTGLPAYWKATSIRLTVPTGGTSDGDTAEATIGYVVDRHDRTFARLMESNAPDAVQKKLGDRPVTGSVQVDGIPWQERRDDDGHLAITRTDGGVTTIVDDGAGKGGANHADLIVLAESLRPVVPTTAG